MFIVALFLYVVYGVEFSSSSTMNTSKTLESVLVFLNLERSKVIVFSELLGDIFVLTFFGLFSGLFLS